MVRSMANSPNSISSNPESDVEAVSLVNEDFKERSNPFDRLVTKSRIGFLATNKVQKFGLLAALVATAFIIGT